MKYLFFLHIMIISFSCKEITSTNVNSTRNSSLQPQLSKNIIYKDTLKVKLLKKVDSVIVRYWDNRIANTYIISYSNSGKLVVSSEHISTENRKSFSDNEINMFVNYVNKFFIDKSEVIVIKKTKKQSIVTDYSSISFTGFINGDEVFGNKTQMGNETYEFEFNKYFLEFNEFLKRLTAIK